MGTNITETVTYEADGGTQELTFATLRDVTSVSWDQQDDHTIDEVVASISQIIRTLDGLHTLGLDRNRPEGELARMRRELDPAESLLRVSKGSFLRDENVISREPWRRSSPFVRFYFYAPYSGFAAPAFSPAWPQGLPLRAVA